MYTVCKKKIVPQEQSSIAVVLSPGPGELQGVLALVLSLKSATNSDPRTRWGELIDQLKQLITVNNESLHTLRLSGTRVEDPWSSA